MNVGVQVYTFFSLWGKPHEAYKVRDAIYLLVKTDSYKLTFTLGAN